MINIDNNSPSFGQVNLIRVSKQAFKNPENIKACEREFNIQLNKAAEEKIGCSKFGFYLSEFLNFFVSVPGKFTFFTEGSKGFKPLDSLPEKNYYSFSVFTGDDRDKISELVSNKAGKKIAKIAASQYTYEDYMKQFSDVRRYMSADDEALCVSKYAKEILKRGIALLNGKVKEAFRGTKIHEFRINSLEELKGLKDKFGFEK